MLSILLASGDLMAAILLCLPLFALYEAGIIVIRLFTGEKKGEISDADEIDDSE
jgi:Sec-independent protein secretion pathway component TatC